MEALASQAWCPRVRATLTTSSATELPTNSVSHEDCIHALVCNPASKMFFGNMCVQRWDEGGSWIVWMTPVAPSHSVRLEAGKECCQILGQLSSEPDCLKPERCFNLGHRPSISEKGRFLTTQWLLCALPCQGDKPRVTLQWESPGLAYFESWVWFLAPPKRKSRREEMPWQGQFCSW